MLRAMAPPFRWLVPDVIAGGPHPDRADHLELADLHGTFDAVLTVFETPVDKRLLEPWGPSYLWLRTFDGEPPDLARSIAFIDEAHARGVATFVHCWAGIGRTGTVLAAWLIHSGACVTAVEARDRVRRDYHEAAMETPQQLAGLERWVKKRK